MRRFESLALRCVALRRVALPWQIRDLAFASKRIGLLQVGGPKPRKRADGYDAGKGSK